MAQTATRWPSEAERRRVDEIVARHMDDRPMGVRRIAYNFGEDDVGNLALYLDLYVDEDLKPTKRAIENLNDYVQILINDVLEINPDYLPYARTLVE